MIISAQKNKLMNSVKILPELMDIKVLELVSGIFLAQKNVSIQMCHIIEIMRRDFSEHHQMQVPITESPLETMTKMSQIAEQISLEYPEILDNYVAELVSDFLFSLVRRRTCG